MFFLKPTEVVLANDEPRFVSKEVIYGYVDVFDAKVDAEPVLDVEVKSTEMLIEEIIEDLANNNDVVSRRCRNTHTFIATYLVADNKSPLRYPPRLLP